ncbi:hypothetical protein [Arthrobacter gyeryongensis]|uniref:hypothetical protein n=1 Tax=Arthrobacter gyeryongensis TaxID=1650592 RepID=UPI0031F148A8
MPQHRPGVVPVPAGQLNQLVQDPPHPDPVTSPVRLGQMLRGSLPFTHRQSHPSRISTPVLPEVLI